jgi:hypothetical protein
MRRLKRPRPTGRRKAGQPDPIDIHVGSRLRLLRTMLRMSQEKLAAELGLTCQQVQNTSARPTESAPAGCITSAGY